MMTRSFGAALSLAALLTLFGIPALAVDLFQVQMHFAAGPMSLAAGQTASACAVNPDSDAVSVLIALLTADSGNLVTSSQATLQPGTGVCIKYTRAAQDIQQPPANVYAVVVPNGRLVSNSRIVQDRPGGGGCIVASLQVQLPGLNNLPGQTIVYAQMVKHVHAIGPIRQ